MSFLNTYENLLGTSGQIGIEKTSAANFLFNLDAESLIRARFGIFDKPSGTIRDVREPIDINSAYSESLQQGFVII